LLGKAATAAFWAGAGERSSKKQAGRKCFAIDHLKDFGEDTARLSFIQTFLGAGASRLSQRWAVVPAHLSTATNFLHATHDFSPR
jgi:hypothetical protein